MTPPVVPLREPAFGDEGRRAWLRGDVGDGANRMTQWFGDWRVVREPWLEPLENRWMILLCREQNWYAWKTTAEKDRPEWPRRSVSWPVKHVLVEGTATLGLRSGAGSTG